MRHHRNRRGANCAVLPIDHFINLHNIKCRIKHDEGHCPGKDECPFCDFEKQAAFEGEEGAKRLEFYSPRRTGPENSESQAPPA
jgi:hypothetical protein